ncbi:5-oxoprolinase subunit PxpB [Alicyclobacillus fastidiosus]|uniref:5-oxoprolinase subunit PxpB n=1 Tax=Alicyclobacillus fastidiosus TaxID=392011 RepID=A0ABV5AEB7_9BACL|nr:5-oxoprolinase subunit PxpB [Alicyclobacillus fastidiosus]WEH09827.1 5-oxoprolinase subunit PxpB [Alicyclobacillus fastidiosus]
MQLDDVSLYALGDSVLVVQFSDSIGPFAHDLVMAFGRSLADCPFYGMVEYVPAFTTVSIFYNPLVLAYEDVQRQVMERLRQLDAEAAPESRIVDIPVCYGGQFGPDLEFVAEYHGLSEDEVIRIHSAPLYQVHMIGFAPGFPYLGGLSERIATPRLTTPRVRIPKGSVGIAGDQTGIYPIETPGGWQLIGKCPVPLFQPTAHPPCLLRAGDRVRFLPITPAEYRELAQDQDVQVCGDTL